MLCLTARTSEGASAVDVPCLVVCAADESVGALDVPCLVVDVADDSVGAVDVPCLVVCAVDDEDVGVISVEIGTVACGLTECTGGRDVAMDAVDEDCVGTVVTRFSGTGDANRAGKTDATTAFVVVAAAADGGVAFIVRKRTVVVDATGLIRESMTFSFTWSGWIDVVTTTAGAVDTGR